jgi:hypothetical protein
MPVPSAAISSRMDSYYQFQSIKSIIGITMELTQYKTLAQPGFRGQEVFFLCYALLSLGCRGRFKMVH